MNAFKINNFAGGLNQSADDSLLSVNQSRDAQNVDVSSGTLKTISGYSKYIAAAAPAGITRLMKFYKNNTSTGAVTSYLLAATATAIYYWTGSAWSALVSPVASGDWDYFNYQIGATDVVIMVLTELQPDHVFHVMPSVILLQVQHHQRFIINDAVGRYLPAVSPVINDSLTTVFITMTVFHSVPIQPINHLILFIPCPAGVDDDAVTIIIQFIDCLYCSR